MGMSHPETFPHGRNCRNRSWLVNPLMVPSCISSQLAAQACGTPIQHSTEKVWWNKLWWLPCVTFEVGTGTRRDSYACRSPWQNTTARFCETAVPVSFGVNENGVHHPPSWIVPSRLFLSTQNYVNEDWKLNMILSLTYVTLFLWSSNMWLSTARSGQGSGPTVRTNEAKLVIPSIGRVISSCRDTRRGHGNDGTLQRDHHIKTPIF
jgi:hypothetical protein